MSSKCCRGLPDTLTHGEKIDQRQLAITLQKKILRNFVDGCNMKGTNKNEPLKRRRAIVRVSVAGFRTASRFLRDKSR